MKRAKPRKGSDLRPADFPALAEFFAAYLHQDFRDEYGSAAKAARQYLREAAPLEAKSLRTEWTRFRTMFAARSFADTQTAIRQLGAAWRPDAEAALVDLDVAIAG